MFVRQADDLPEKVAGVRVGPVLIVRDLRQAKALETFCASCPFRVVLNSELKMRRRKGRAAH